MRFVNQCIEVGDTEVMAFNLSWVQDGLTVLLRNSNMHPVFQAQIRDSVGFFTPWIWIQKSGSGMILIPDHGSLIQHIF
jgi:hypothetical protein